MKWITAAIAAMVLGAGVWHWEGLHALAGRQPTAWWGQVMALAPWSKPQAPVAQTVIYKCSSAAGISYASTPCAQGHLQSAITDAAVSVVDAYQPSLSERLKPPALPAQLPHARALLGDSSAPSFVDQHIERATK